MKDEKLLAVLYELASETGKSFERVQGADGNLGENLAAGVAALRDRGGLTVDIVAALKSRRIEVTDPSLQSWTRPIAAWSTKDGDATLLGSYMGGAPAMYSEEPWPTAGEDGPLRFWAQINLADLAVYAEAYGIECPRDGLIQLFDHPEAGYSYARYIPQSDFEQVELRWDIPPDFLYDDDEAHTIVRKTKVIEFYPEVMVWWMDAELFIDDDIDQRKKAITSEDIPGYSFGWPPFSTSGFEKSAQELGKPHLETHEWAFPIVCDTDFDLGLCFSDAGFLWAMIPQDDFAAGKMDSLRADGESS